MKSPTLFLKVILSVTFLFFIHLVGKANSLYNQTIYAATISDGGYNQSLADLKNYLEKSTGKKFTLSDHKNTVAEGICILLNKPGLLAPELNRKLQNGTIEDFVISADGKKLLLVATHPKGLSLAIYSYLDQLGVKWYFPGDEWTYIPTLSKIDFISEKYVTPSFHLRNFFGTGGIVPNKALDPENGLQQSWDLWKRRNRLGGEVELGGHYGETFNLNHRAELEKHPEYLATIKGKRAPWSVGVKWCISNKDLRALFVKDRVDFLKQTLANHGTSNAKITIPVDPADGYEDCECNECKKLGTGSDRVFLLANEVAKAVAKISPLAYPNLYAYNTHATPPPFSLEPNLIVQVIPYAFQSVGTPQQMLALWQKKGNLLYLYDYYGLPDWHFDTPLSGGWAPQSLVNKLKDWQKFDIKGFLLESSFSIGSTGMSLYLASRLGWNMAEDVIATQKLYYKQMFGEAAPEIANYYQKVNGDFSGAADMPYLLSLLDKAAAASKSAVIKNRIEKLQAYVHYLVLYYVWQSALPEKKEAAWENLVEYVWKIYPLGMVHATRIAELLNAQVAANTALVTKWNVYTPGEKVKNTKFITSKELAEIIKKDKEKYPLLAGFHYTQSAAATNYAVKQNTVKEEVNPEGMMLLDFPEMYVEPAADGYFRFGLKVNEGSENNAHQSNTVHCVDIATGKEVFTQTVAIDKNWKKLSIKLQTGKRYRLTIDHSGWIRIHVPQNQWAGFKNIPTYAVMNTLWFYIAPGTKYIYYSNGGTEQPSFFDHSNKPILPEKVNDQNMYRMVVPSAASGKWWTLTNGQYKTLQFHSYPDFFFSHPNYIGKTP